MKNDLEAQLRDACQQAIKAGWSVNGIARAAGVDQPALSRFLNKKASEVTDRPRGMKLETASALASWFGMRLTVPRIPPVE
jgi:hypothetical protein